MKYYIIAGEASGDLHGSNLLKKILAVDNKAEVRFWGGDLMEKVANTSPVKHYKDLAFMGFVEVIKHLPTILSNLSFCKKDIKEWQPDGLILIDYPGFNLRIAEWAKANGIKVYYYVSPQIWAWKESRVHKIKKIVDKMFVILPFESDFYQKYNFPVSYVGHPLVEAIQQYRENSAENELKISNDKPIIALLPGSRRQEITALLSVMLEMVKIFDKYHFIIAAAPSIPIDFYEAFIKKYNAKNLSILSGETYNILKNSKAAIVTSGTATLETALFNIPQIVCYKGSQISYWLAKKLIKVKYISLPNLILNELAITELIQDDCNVENLKLELNSILEGERRDLILEKYEKLSKMLGDGDTSTLVANQIFYDLSNS